MKMTPLDAKIARNIALLVDGPDPASAGDMGSVTATDLGEWLGLSAPRIHALAREGRIPRRGDGRFDLKPAVRGYVESLRQKAGSSALAQNPELNAEKIRMARESADKTALQNARARGEMIATADVAKAWAEIVTDLRAALLALPSRVAASVGLDRAAMTALDREMRDALESIADDA
jgi:phage terminase Nu1 subunit (DNA packaging protein)